MPEINKRISEILDGVLLSEQGIAISNREKDVDINYKGGRRSFCLTGTSLPGFFNEEFETNEKLKDAAEHKRRSLSCIDYSSFSLGEPNIENKDEECSPKEEFQEKNKSLGKKEPLDELEEKLGLPIPIKRYYTYSQKETELEEVQSSCGDEDTTENLESEPFDEVEERRQAPEDNFAISKREAETKAFKKQTNNHFITIILKKVLKRLTKLVSKDKRRHKNEILAVETMKRDRKTLEDCEYYFDKNPLGM